MLDRIEFQKKAFDAAHDGRLHIPKLAGVFFDLVESCKSREKCDTKSECNCQAPDTDIRLRELTDAFSGLNEGFKSLTMKIDELENKIELMSKGSKRLKLKEE